ncbi:hypothetical protein [Patulibacter sp.]|uniref:virginiamycin B lyase family protein n=1 Tax=Patulibacter sp. TaxID=1912859 RepID=UPI00271D814C|nr:hypothetical protein [Patulibacter sp.]MDO9410425.1 hypothetical protein [Patulibacter sp.]
MLLSLLLPSVAGAVVTTEATDPTPGAAPSGMTATPDGSVWFTDPADGRIGRLGPTNAFEGFAAAVPSPTGRPPTALTPGRIALGPDGALWFTATQGGFGRITPEGQVSRYSQRTVAGATGITAGPDGAMWFTVPGQDFVGRITAPSDAQVAAGTARGVISVYALPAGSAPDDIELGQDGALWFTEPGTGRLGRAVPDPQGPTITEVVVPTPGSTPSRLSTGPDGRIWFSVPGTRTIGRIGGNGLVVEMPLPAGVGVPGDVAAAPDGALWFVESGGTRDALGRITDAGQVTRYELPDPQGGPVELVRGADGDLRYSRAGGRIGRVDTLRSAAEQPPPQAVPPALSAVAGRTVIVEVVSGSVRVRRPGRGAYEPLEAGGALIPDGTEVDATKGRVRLTAETAPGSGITRTAIFWDGRFVVHQARVAGAATEVRLTGRLACGSGAPGRGTTTPRAGAGAQALTRAAKRKGRKRPKVGRRLWGDGKGDFRTRGSRATASVRGTRWLVEDRCDRTTRVRVFEGIVGVRDRVTGRRVTLTDGAQYVAPGPRRRR